MRAFTVVLFLGEIAAKATLLLLLAFAITGALRRRGAAGRHWLWTITFAGLALLPLYVVLLPSLSTITLPDRYAPSVTPPPARTPDQRHPLEGTDGGRADAVVSVRTASAPWPERAALPLLLVWGGGAGVLLGRVLWSRRRAAGIARRAHPAGALWGPTTDPEVRSSDELAVPCTIGVLRPIILVPSDSESEGWSADWRRSAVAHERAHIERRDPLIQAAVEVVRALYWFHPLVWMAARKMSADREIAADDAVLTAGEYASDYASLLVHLAASCGRRRFEPTVAMLGRRTLRARFAAILDETTRRTPWTPRTQRLTAALGVALLLPALAMASVAQRRAPSSLPPRPLWQETRGLPRSGFLAGRVFEPRTGRPVSGADVDLLSELSLPLAHSRTDENGRYRLGPLPRLRSSNTYGLYVRSAPLAGRHRLEVPPDVSVTFDVSLEETGPDITGRVSDEAGRPVAGARVFFGRDYARDLHPGFSADVATGPDGRYRISGVLPGDFVLFVRSERHNDSRRRVVVTKEGAQGVDFILPEMAVLTGQVVDQDGAAVPHARLWIRFLQPAGTSGTRWSETRVDGTFRDKIFRANVMLRAASAERGLVSAAVVVPAERLEGVELKLTKGAFIRGVVREASGAPAAAFSVTCANRQTGLRWPDGEFTDEAGRFTLGPLVAGDYVVAAGIRIFRYKAPLAAPDGPSLRNVHLVGGQDVTGIELVRPPPKSP
jgi:beta-lactamase regulating signal transducer with metallopeptidase domain